MTQTEPPAIPLQDRLQKNDSGIVRVNPQLLVSELRASVPQTDRDQKMWKFLQEGSGLADDISQLVAQKQGRDLLQGIMHGAQGSVYFKWIDILYKHGLGADARLAKEPNIEDLYQPLVLAIVSELVNHPEAFDHIFTTKRGGSIYFVLSSGHCMRFKRKYSSEDVDMMGAALDTGSSSQPNNTDKRYFRFSPVSKCYFISPEEFERIGQLLGADIRRTRQIGDVQTTDFQAGCHPFELMLPAEHELQVDSTGMLDMTRVVWKNPYGREDSIVWDQVSGVHAGTEIDRIIK